MVVRGTSAGTASASRALVAALDPERVLVVGDGGVAPGAVRRHLGRTLAAVVLDLHEGLDADVLGQVGGLVQGGGALVLRMPPVGERPGGQARLAVAPYAADAVTLHLWSRLERALGHSPAVVEPEALARPAPPDAGSSEQGRVVASLQRVLGTPMPSATVLLADRGRGKSAALGLALRALSGRAVVTASDPAACAEVVRFAGDRPAGPLVVREPAELLRHPEPCDILVVDEAARLSVALLQALVRAHPGARLAFATTTRGYEGTGRGFVLRFLDWLDGTGLPIHRQTLTSPIRWAADDPLEALIHQVLCLDATPAAALPPPDAPVVHTRVDRARLAQDEARLRQVFGLLVHAHYRTTPGDLHRLLDAPNLELHVLEQGEAVVAVALQAREGGFDRETCLRLARGQGRIRGHALADTLICHASETWAGQLDLLRSVRTAVHPARRRQGLGAQLVRAVNACSSADLFGTVFSATAEVVRFRQSLGYEVVRVGVARSGRSGEPAVVMVKAGTSKVSGLVARLRQELARDLDAGLSLLEADDGLPLEPALRAALSEGLPAVRPRSPAEELAIVQAYTRGPRPLDTAFVAVRDFVRRADLERLDEADRQLVQERILEGRSWAGVAEGRGWTVRAVMRRLRRVVATLEALHERVPGGS